MNWQYLNYAYRNTLKLIIYIKKSEKIARNFHIAPAYLWSDMADG